MSLTKVSYSMITGASVNILDFGAVRGADNTNAIIAAIASITSGVGTKVILCESIISTMITIDKENVTFTSNGESLLFSPTMALVPMGNAGFDNYTMFWVNHRYVNFVNTVFDGNGFNPTTLGGAAFFYWGSAGGGYDASYGSVLDCTFLDLIQQSNPVGYTVCIGARQNATGMVVRNCKFINASAAIQFNTLSAGIIDGCVSTITSAQRSTDLTHPTGYYADQSFGLDGAGKGSMIINCTVQREGAGTPYSGTNIGCSQGCTEFTIANNKVIGLGGAGTAYFISGTYGVVTGNVADGLDEAVRAAWGMMRFEPYVGTDFPSNLVISNNVIKGPLQGGVATFGYGMKFPSSSMTVEGNTFALGSSNRIYAAMRVYEEVSILGTPTQIQNNNITGPSRGISFEITDNGGVPIILEGNSYFGPLTEAYTADPGIIPPVYVTYNDTYGPNITSLTAALNWNSWTPSLGGNTTYLARSGYYKKIGDLVYVKLTLYINAIGTGSTTIISGLPYSASRAGAINVSNFSAVATNTVSLVGYASGSTITMNGQTAASATNATPIATFQNATYIEMNGWYTIL
jgi:hypothetical protein